MYLLFFSTVDKRCRYCGRKSLFLSDIGSKRRIHVDFGASYCTDGCGIAAPILDT